MDLPEFPSEFVPTMWSDFEFWGNLFQEQGKNMVSWMAAGPAFRDMELWTSSFMAVLLSVCASAFTAARSNAGIHTLLQKNDVLLCGIYTDTLPYFIQDSLCSQYDLLQSDVSSAMSLDMCGFSLLLSERNTCRRCP